MLSGDKHLPLLLCESNPVIPVNIDPQAVHLQACMALGGSSVAGSMVILLLVCFGGGKSRDVGFAYSFAF
jgi:hypothetical protein